MFKFHHRHSTTIISLFLFFSSIAVIGVWLRHHFSQLRSIQAFVNGEIIVVRASLPGQLNLKSEKIHLGKTLDKGVQIGTIKSTVENPRVSVLTIDQEQLKNRLQDVQQQLDGITQQIQNRTKLMTLFTQQTVTQRKLQTKYASQQIQEYEGEIASAKAREKVVLADAQRFAQLAKEGAETLSNAENAMARAKQASAVVRETQAKIEQGKLSLEATKVGLQLEGARTLSFPEIRVLELDAELTDLQKEKRNLEKQIQGIQLQLSSTIKELQIQKTVSVLSPIKGLIWSIDTQPQEIVQANQSIIQLLNCQNLWVEAFINETDTDKLAVGQEAEISLNSLSTNGKLKGRVETIRAGTGRVEVGQYIAEPPPEIARRQLPVRVAAVRIKTNFPETPRVDEFCLAGRSVNVRFLDTKYSF